MHPDRLHIEPTRRTPRVLLEKGRIFVMGRSISENPGSFYESIHDWVAAYAKSWPGKTKIELGFEYINTGSIKWLYMLLRDFSEMSNIPEDITITWYYEEGDEDMSELGYIIKSLIESPFSIVRVEDMNEDLYRSFLSKPV